MEADIWLIGFGGNFPCWQLTLWLSPSGLLVLFCNIWCEPGPEEGARHGKGPAGSHTLNLSAPPSITLALENSSGLVNSSAPWAFLDEHVVPQWPALAYTTAWLFPQKGHPSFWAFWGAQDIVKWEPEEYSDLVNTSRVPQAMCHSRPKGHFRALPHSHHEWMSSKPLLHFIKFRPGIMLSLCNLESSMDTLFFLMENKKDG